MRDQRVIWSPQPKQLKLMQCPADETFFGGAKGGGKTDGMLGDFLAHASRNGDAAIGIFFRRSYKELEDVIERSKYIYNKMGAVFKISTNTWIFPNGAILRLRYIERDTDVMKYQGQSYSWICIDELGNYPSPYVYNNMLSCLRSAKGVKCQMRSSGNPGGPGHAWVKRRFIDGQTPDKIYSFNTFIPDGEGGTSKVTFSRCFIPSNVNDNKILMRNDPMYVARLHQLPEHLKRAFLFGDWDVFVGQVFGEIGPDHYMDDILIPHDWVRFATVDWGYSKPYSIGFWAVNDSGRLMRIGEDYGCVKGMEDTGVKLDALTVAKRLVPTLNALGITRVYADPAVWQKHGHGMSIAALFEKAGINLTPGRRDRKASLAVVHTMLQTVLDDGFPMLRIFRSCKDWIRTVPSLVGSKLDIEDVDTHGEDHIYDDMRYAVTSIEVQNASRGWLDKKQIVNMYSDEEKDYAV